MTKALERAFRAASSLPDAAQDALAAAILEEVSAEQRGARTLPQDEGAPETFRKETQQLSKLLEQAKKAAKPSKGLDFSTTVFGAAFTNDGTAIRIRSVEQGGRAVSVVVTASSLLGPGPGETPEQKALREQLAKDFPAAFGCKALDDACAKKLNEMLQSQSKAVDTPFAEFASRGGKLSECLETAACAGISAEDRAALDRVIRGLDAMEIAKSSRVLENLNANGGKLAIKDSYVCSSQAVATPGKVDLGLCTDGFTFQESGLPEKPF